MVTHNSGRAGFTLVEVMVATALAGVVLLGARQILVQLADSTEEIVDAAAGADRDANAERLLRSLLGRAEIDVEAGARFIGNERTARFTTWCDLPAGWQERCDVVISLIPHDDRQALAILFAEGEPVVVLRDMHHGGLRYLSDPGSGGEWIASWGEGVTIPVGLGVITDGDTLILRIGERG